MAARVAGVSFPELIRTRVLEPAGLTDTFLGLPAELLPRVARVAGANGEGTDWAIYSSLYGSQIGHPAYGVVATVEDVLRFLLLFDPLGERRLHSMAGSAHDDDRSDVWVSQYRRGLSYFQMGGGVRVAGG